MWQWLQSPWGSWWCPEHYFLSRIWSSFASWHRRQHAFFHCFQLVGNYATLSLKAIITTIILITWLWMISSLMRRLSWRRSIVAALSDKPRSKSTLHWVGLDFVRQIKHLLIEHPPSSSTTLTGINIRVRDENVRNENQDGSSGCFHLGIDSFFVVAQLWYFTADPVSLLTLGPDLDKHWLTPLLFPNLLLHIKEIKMSSINIRRRPPVNRLKCRGSPSKPAPFQRMPPHCCLGLKRFYEWKSSEKTLRDCFPDDVDS